MKQSRKSRSLKRYLVILIEAPVWNEEISCHFARAIASCYEEACALAKDEFEGYDTGKFVSIAAFDEAELGDVLNSLITAKISDKNPVDIGY